MSRPTTPPTGHTCSQCAFYQPEPTARGAWGYCVVEPPNVYSDNAVETGFLRYRRVAVGESACSQIMSPQEWAAYRTRISEALLRPAGVVSDVVPAVSRP